MLSAKARAGTLTAKEVAEAGKYELVGHLLNIMQSKARRSLKSPRDLPSPLIDSSCEWNHGCCTYSQYSSQCRFSGVFKNHHRKRLSRRWHRE